MKKYFIMILLIVFAFPYSADAQPATKKGEVIRYEECNGEDCGTGFSWMPNNDTVSQREKRTSYSIQEANEAIPDPDGVYSLKLSF